MVLFWRSNTHIPSVTQWTDTLLRPVTFRYMRCRCRTSYKGRRLSVYMRQATGETSISWHITAGRRATTEENLNHKETRAYKNREVGDTHINCGILIYGPASHSKPRYTHTLKQSLFHDCPIPLLVHLVVIRRLEWCSWIYTNEWSAWGQ